MAQQALPQGAVRRRAAFGLLDAEGWGWAGLRAVFWFLVIIFLLAYIPNLAYYFTVSSTVDVGYNAVPIVNWCPASNEDLPCPAPPGTVLPWQDSPAELALPSARAGAAVFQSGTHLYLIGGTTAEGATAETLQTEATLDGNFGQWRDGPDLPEPRTGAALASYVGVPYVIGGLDAAGQPTRTVYIGQVEEGLLTGWLLADGTEKTPDLTLKEPISGASAAVGTAGIVLLGGRSADGLSDAVLVSNTDDTPQARLLPWKELGQLPLPEPRADAATVAVGSTIYVSGGEGPDGPTTSVYRLTLQDGGPVVDDKTGKVTGWGIAPDDQDLPSARTRATAFTANGTLYVIGGEDASGAPQSSVLWAVPSSSTGDLPGGWQRMSQTELPAARAAAAAASVGSTLFLIGGDGAAGPEDSSVRAGLSPQPPYFRLGLFGLTIPALSIKGEIGQQLGYINAMTVGMVNFAILILVGLAFSHRAQTMRLIARLSRGRLKVPREDEYRA